MQASKGILANNEEELNKLKEESTIITEEINIILRENSKIIAESDLHKEFLIDSQQKTQEIARTNEKMAEIKEKIESIKEKSIKIEQNEQLIKELEDSISNLAPLIEKQKDYHKSILVLNAEIELLKKEIKLAEIKNNEQDYLTKLRFKLEKSTNKLKVFDEIILKLDSYDIEGKKSEKETYELIKKTLKQQINEIDPNENKDFIIFSKLKNKKFKLQSAFDKKKKNYETEYESLSLKLQKKQAKKSSLETQLGELKNVYPGFNSSLEF